MTVAELASIAKTYAPEGYEVFNARRYKDVYIFSFYNYNLEPRKQILDNFVCLDPDGERTSLDIWNWDIWSKTSPISDKDWKKHSPKPVIEHYGRKGMHWYEHIFGDEDPRGKYSHHSNVGNSKIGFGARLNSMRRMSSDTDPTYKVSWTDEPQFDFKLNSVNPNYGKGAEWSTNCGLCTTAAELKTRGYDVRAASNSKGNSFEQLCSFFKGGKEAAQYMDYAWKQEDGSYKMDVQKNRRLFNQFMDDLPAGARANISFHPHGSNIGHSVYGERTETGWNVYDFQNGTKWDSNTYDKWFNNSDYFSALRMDNLEIDDDTIDDAIEDWDWRKDMNHSINITTIQEYLEHYGRLGMRWYQHRFGEADSRAKYVTKASGDELKYGLQNLKNAKTSNLDKWGADADHNVCYIAGYSGSGKSTTARSIAGKDDNVIHLDLYTEPIIKKDTKNQDKEFNAFLDKKVPKWRDIPKRKFDSQDYWDIVDRFSNAIDEFGKQQYPKKKVVAEGIQLTDNEFLGRTNESYKNKPVIIMQTGALKSINQALKRDNRSWLKTLTSKEQLQYYIHFYSVNNKSLKDLVNATDSAKGELWVNDYLKNC